MEERELRLAIVDAVVEAGIRANDPGPPNSIGMAVPFGDDVLGASVTTRFMEQTVTVHVFSITAYGPRPAESPHLPELVELLEDLTSEIAAFHYEMLPLGVPAASLDLVFDDEATTDGISAEVASVLEEMFADYATRMPTFAEILEGFGTSGSAQS